MTQSNDVSLCHPRLPNSINGQAWLTANGKCVQPPLYLQISKCSSTFQQRHTAYMDDENFRREGSHKGLEWTETCKNKNQLIPGLGKYVNYMSSHVEEHHLQRQTRQTVPKIICGKGSLMAPHRHVWQKQRQSPLNLP